MAQNGSSGSGTGAVGFPRTEAEMAALEAAAGTRGVPLVALFGAEFHEASKRGGAMDRALAALATDARFAGKAVFAKCDAEELEDAAERLGVEVVPTTVLLKASGSGGALVVVDRLTGADPTRIVERLERLTASAAASSSSSSGAAAAASAGNAAATSTSTTTTTTTTTAESKDALFKRIDKLVASSYVFCFIKGTPQEPKCKFTRKLLEMFAQQGVTEFGSFNVLADEAVRQGLKEYSNWPTFPQVFSGGKLVGGVDVCEELAAQNELKKTLAPPPPALPVGTAPPTKANALEDRLRSLVNQSPVMIFIKGTPTQPVCGFSAQLVQLLQTHAPGVAYGSFNILEDPAVREGLKKFSDWPTYPQVYVGGKLVGGLDICKELAQDGSLQDALTAPAPAAGGNL